MNDKIPECDPRDCYATEQSPSKKRNSLPIYKDALVRVIYTPGCMGSRYNIQSATSDHYQSQLVLSFDNSDEPAPCKITDLALLSLLRHRLSLLFFDNPQELVHDAKLFVDKAYQCLEQLNTAKTIEQELAKIADQRQLLDAEEHKLRFQLKGIPQ